MLEAERRGGSCSECSTQGECLGERWTGVPFGIITAFGIAEIAEQGQRGAKKHAWPGDGTVAIQIDKCVLKNEGPGSAMNENLRRPVSFRLAGCRVSQNVFLPSRSRASPGLAVRGHLLAPLLVDISSVRAAEPAATLCREGKWLRHKPCPLIENYDYVFETAYASASGCSHENLTATTTSRVDI